MKILYIFLISIFFLILNSNELHAHSRSIKGIVKNEEGKPIPNATIRLENTLLGTIANIRGEFILRRIPDGEFKLVVTAVGYQPFFHQIVFTHEDGDDEFELSVTMFESINYSENVVVTANKTHKIYEDTPVKVSVIDDKIFESTQSVSLRDGLRFQAGLRIEANCQNCGYSQVRLNGLEGRYSQILIDNRPIISTLNSMYGLDQIPSNMIEKIEVVRGGGSSIYGGNAIGGIINIVTKTPEANSFDASIQQSYLNGNIPDKSIQLSSSNVTLRQDAGIFFFGNYRERDAWDANNDGFTESAYIRESSIGARAFYSPNIYSKLSIDFHTINEYRRGGDRIELPPHLTLMAEDMTHSIIGGGLSYEHYFNNNLTKLSVYSSVNITNKESYTGINYDANGYGTTESTVSATGAQLAYTLKDFFIGSSVITAGTEFQYDEVSNKASSYRTSLNQQTKMIGFYLQKDWLMSDEFNLLFGARMDKHNFINSFIFNPRLSMMYKPAKDLVLRGNLTTGYRSPQAFDDDLHEGLRSGKRMIIELDKNLKEERSFGYSISTDYTYFFDEIPITVSIEYFNSILSDVFVNQENGIDANGNILVVKSNGDGAKISGISSEIKTVLSNSFQIQTGLTYQTSKYDSPIIWSDLYEENNDAIYTTTDFLRTPNLYGFFTIYSNLSEYIELNVTGVFTGEMTLPHYAGGITPDGTINQSDKLVDSPSFFELNIQTKIELLKNPSISLNLGVSNLFNQFQNDFDRGENRDSDYIYGSLKPRTYSIGLKFNL